MLIECCIDREGPTTVTKDAVDYVFIPMPTGHCVADVSNQGHADQLLKMRFYRPYDPSKPAKKVNMLDPDDHALREDPPAQTAAPAPTPVEKLGKKGKDEAF